ncbi:autotransporter domain-containing protein [Leeia aquatica]|uniref:Autotransporter domain-containing protein n=1 Tax=Leeia aquatica TaxID=2725557 RepID=A0A847SJ36_9NEIS|nr:autotransporter domain-containing protein [Leeia aquatica]NLR75912.1 autotransporter domain-containing protein [Leeia aquatica]
MNVALAAGGGLAEYAPFNGGTYANFQVISPDGRTVAGYARDGSRTVAVRWTSAGGMENLGSMFGGSATSVTGLSADGSVLVGTGQLAQNALSYRAYRWTRATGPQDLGTLPMGGNSHAAAVSADGSMVVGVAYNAATYQRGFLWTSAQGMQDLGELNGGHSSAALALSADGSVIVGRAADGHAGGNDRAVRWSNGSGPVSLGVLSGHQNSVANAISADGQVITGTSYPGPGITDARAFRWTATDGMQNLGTLPGGAYSLGLGISAGGSTIVGRSEAINLGALRAFRWTQATGMQSVEQWLADNGVVVNSFQGTQEAHATNQDGSIVVGSMNNGNAFIACVRSCGNGGSGLIDVQQFNGSLYSVAHQQNRSLGESDLVMNGLHSRPTAFTLKTGQGTMWVGGDLGRAERVPGKGTVGNGELGVAYGLTDTLMLRAAVGRTGSDIDSDGGSNVETSGTFVLPELVAQLGDSPFLLSASAYYNSGKARIRRGYLNAGTPEHADGTPDVSSKALRLRLDWMDAYKSERLSLTPYASMSWYRSHVDGYTEKGGNFPVSWEAQQERQSILRLGTDLRYALSDNVTLTGLLELAHRSRQNGEGAQGRIIGLSSFKLEGMAYPRSWVRLGVGLDAKVGPGILAVMLNANSRNSGNRWWLNASYRIPF